MKKEPLRRLGFEFLLTRRLLTATTVLDLRADIDDDGKVGFGDFLKLSSEFGNEASNGESVDSDINMDGRVFFDDFLLFSESFGRNTDIATASLSIRNDASTVDEALSVYGGLSLWEDIEPGETTQAIDVPLNSVVAIRDDGVACDLFEVGVADGVEIDCQVFFDGDPQTPNLGIEQLELDEGGSYIAIIEDASDNSGTPLRIRLEPLTS